MLLIIYTHRNTYYVDMCNQQQQQQQQYLAATAQLQQPYCACVNAFE